MWKLCFQMGDIPVRQGQHDLAHLRMEEDLNFADARACQEPKVLV